MKKKPFTGFVKKGPAGKTGPGARKPFGKPSFGKPAFAKPAFAKPAFEKPAYEKAGSSDGERAPRRGFGDAPRPFNDGNTFEGGAPRRHRFESTPKTGFQRFGKSRFEGETGGDDKPARFGDAKPSRPFGDARPSRPFGDAKPSRPFGDAKPNRPFGDAKPSRPFGDAKSSRPFARKGADGGARPFFGGGQGRPRGAKPFDQEFEAPLDRPTGSFVHRSGPRPFNGHGGPSRQFEDLDDRRTSGKAAGRKVNLNFDDLIYGVHAVEEALKSGESVKSLHVGRGRDRDPIVAELCAAAERLEVPVKFEDAAWFDQIAYKAHQSIVAIGEPFEYVTLEEAIEKRSTNRLIVILDHLTDPHNVGAILRSAECAGAQAAVLPDRRSAGINATVRKAAAGATSHLPIAKVGNLATTLRELKNAGFTVIGAALDETSQSLAATDFSGDVALVIGAEGEGLARLVAKTCDHLVKIPLLGKTESLNASVAAGILLYEVVRKRESLALSS